MNPHIFREYDIRGIVGDDLNEEVVVLLGKGIGTYLLRNGAKRVSVGRDGRLSSPDMRDYLFSGLRSVGVDVVDLGVVPTPVSYYSSHVINVDATVMITGSHNPSNYNGFKITLKNKAIFGQNIQDILEIIQAGEFETGSGQIEEKNLLPQYIDDLAERLSLVRPVSLAVDCGNGVGSLTAGPLLEKLGCRAKMMFDDIDGNFPNHHPDPTVEKNLEDLNR